MSVQDKLQQFQARRDEIRMKRREFADYTNEFTDGVAKKQDTTDLEKAVAQLCHVFETTSGVFNEYNDQFVNDVQRKQDVSELTAAAEALRGDFEATDGQFDAYAHIFEQDVGAISDISELLDAIESLRASFADVENAFERYNATFDQTVVDFQGIVEDQRHAFDTYTESIQDDIQAIRTPAELLAGIEQMAASFTDSRDAFHAYATSDFVEQVSGFQAGTAAMRASYRDTDENFAAYTDRFYGISPEQSSPTESATGPSQSSTVSQDPHSTTEPDTNQSVAVDEQQTAEPEEEPNGDDEDSSTELGNSTSNNENTEPSADISGSVIDPIDAPDEHEDMIPCRICGEHYKAITEPHLQTHDYTITEYRDEFGEGVPLRPGEDE